MLKSSNIILIAVFLLFSISAKAQSSAGANISATIVAPMGAEKGDDLNFGEFFLPANSAQVYMSPTNERVISGKLEMSNTNFAEAATLKILNNDFAFGVTVQQQPVTIINYKSSQTLIVDEFAVSSKVKQSGQHFELLSIGARLTISPSKAELITPGTNSFTVMINFN